MKKLAELKLGAHFMYGGVEWVKFEDIGAGTLFVQAVSVDERQGGRQRGKETGKMEVQIERRTGGNMGKKHKTLAKTQVLMYNINRIHEIHPPHLLLIPALQTWGGENRQYLFFSYLLSLYGGEPCPATCPERRTNREG